MSDVYINSQQTNFDKTLTALVLAKVAENIRRELKYLVPGAFITGSLIAGTNLIRHVKFSDLSILAPAQSDGTPPWLTEGVAPEVEALSITYDEYGVNQAGRGVGITDRALKFSPFALARIAAEALAFNALATWDAIIASTVQAITATTTNSHAAGALTTSDYISADIVRLQVARLRALGAPPLIGDDYVAMIHPYAIYDLMGDSKWQDVAKYATPDNMLTGEVGRLYGVRFISNIVGTWVNNTGGGSNNIPVYSTLFMGRGMYAIGDFGSMESHMVRPGGDHSDFLAQKMLLGWKAWFGAKVLSTQNLPGGTARAIRLVHAGSVSGGAAY